MQTIADKYRIKEFETFIRKHRTDKIIRLYFDIETLQYNAKNANYLKKPTVYKNVAYSVAVSYYDDDMLKVALYPSFKEMIDGILLGFKNLKTGKISGRARIELIAHNNNKYDNHFLQHDILYYYPYFKRYNLYLKNALSNENTKKKSDFKKSEQHGIILEKRVKSSNNLDFSFYFYGIEFTLIDNFMKTHTSIATLGKKLLKAGLIEKDELKTDFNYTEYNTDIDMTEDQAHQYALQVFDRVKEDPKKVTYIRNDVIILAKSVRYYDVIYPNFDYSRITFSSNVLDYYNDNALASFQLLKRVQYEDEKRPRQVDFTQYHFANENLFDYLRPFYKGGLNFYNYKYLGELVHNLFSMDINSSYPYVMYSQKIPTYFIGAKHFNGHEQTILLDLDNTDEFSLYRISKKEMNALLRKTQSRVIREMFVKYYTVTGNEYVNINTNTIRTFQEVTGITINQLNVFSFITFGCEYFGSREHIKELYFIKTQGKLKHKIVMKTPMDYTILDELNTDFFTKEEIDLAKVYLNGIYGIPALRPYFNLFRLNEDELTYHNEQNGYKNSSRNIIFSIFVTSGALRNLLSPLHNLTDHEIDDYFVYCDTDSLYMKQDAFKKIDKSILDPISLGAWDIENEHIEKMYVLNHKKYTYQIKKKDRTIIKVKSGGIAYDTFNLKKRVTLFHVKQFKKATLRSNPCYKLKDGESKKIYTDFISIEQFIDTQFSDGKALHAQKSILNSQGTISIYPSTTIIEKGSRYDQFFTERREQQKNELLEKIRHDLKENPIEESYLYIESSIGSFSQNDIEPVIHDTTQTKPLNMLIQYETFLKQEIERE